MLDNFQGFLLSMILIAIPWLYVRVRRGPVAALGTSMVLSFAFPVWVKIDLWGAPVNVSTAIAIFNFLGFLLNPRKFHPQGKILVPLTILDFCIALMYFINVASDSFTTGLTLWLPCLAYGEWVLPYVAGRYAVSDRNDLKWIAPWVAGVLLFLGVMSCIESLTQVNPFEFVFGNRPRELAGRNMMRFEAKRAFGPTTHPIFFGMLIAVLIPWLVCMWQSFESRLARTFTVFAGLMALTGAVFTLSRTPVLTILITMTLILALRIKVVRWPLALSAALIVIAFAAFPNEVTDTVSRWTGGSDKQRLIEIDGEAVVTSSSRTRLHVFDVYADALKKAGLFGYGSAATSGFPVRIPNMAVSYKSANLFEMVDNGYILLTLRFGWFGGVGLVFTLLGAITTGLALNSERSNLLFPGAIACLLTTVACFSLLLVFMSYDFGLPLLWTMGVLSGLTSARINNRLSALPNRDFRS